MFYMKETKCVDYAGSRIQYSHTSTRKEYMTSFFFSVRLNKSNLDKIPLSAVVTEYLMNWVV